jgi:hypothetical protein
MTDFPDLKIKALISFPATVLDGKGIDVVKANGNYQFNLAYDDFAPPLASVPDAAHQTALIWNTLTGVYALVPVSLFTTRLDAGIAAALASAIAARDGLHSIPHTGSVAARLEALQVQLDVLSDAFVAMLQAQGEE